MGCYTGVKRSCGATMSFVVVGDVIETAQVVRRIFEVGNTAIKDEFSERSDQRQEGGFTGAVFADQEGERRERNGLALAEAAEVLDGDAVHHGGAPRSPAYHAQLVTAPRSAPLTKAAYLANTPLS